MLAELAELHADHRPGTCIMCDEPCAPGRRLFCIDPECEREYKRIYHRAYGHVRRAGISKDRFLRGVVRTREEFSPSKRTFARLRCGHEIETTKLRRHNITARICTVCRAASLQSKA